MRRGRGVKCRARGSARSHTLVPVRVANKPGVRVVLGGGPSPFRCPCSASASVSARRACKEPYRYLNTVPVAVLELGEKTTTSSVCWRPTHLEVVRSRTYLFTTSLVSAVPVPVRAMRLPRYREERPSNACHCTAHACIMTCIAGTGTCDASTSVSCNVCVIMHTGASGQHNDAYMRRVYLGIVKSIHIAKHMNSSPRPPGALARRCPHHIAAG